MTTIKIDNPIPPGDYLLMMDEIDGAFIKSTIAIGPYAGRTVFMPRAIAATIENEEFFVNGQVAYPKKG